MNERDQNIVAAAQRVFARYGVGKTTMNDIATEAGIARQTLYNSYPNKNEVLRATVRAAIASTFEKIETEWAKEQTFGGKLDQFFEHVPLHWYDMVQSSPDVAELVDGIHTVAATELKQAKAKWTGLFANLIAEHTNYTDDKDALGEYIYATALNAKIGADNRAVIVTRLSLLKKSVLALLGDTLLT